MILYDMKQYSIFLWFDWVGEVDTGTLVVMFGYRVGLAVISHSEVRTSSHK
jgi:hypothetical protein